MLPPILSKTPARLRFEAAGQAIRGLKRLKQTGLCSEKQL